ncbi:MAG TPA: HAD family phosphatase [Stellaceae bacterium]|jgi:beta-phosphoglucomutase-like phosphatase (HAD superfamily)|nr:HAD family phosphatase [Stellaceae bacterium]
MTRNVQRGIFFNLENTLADSAGALRDAFDRFAAQCRVVPSDQVFAEISGISQPMAVALLKRRWSLPYSLDEIKRHYAPLIDAAFQSIAPTESAATTLETAFRNGWSVGIVTAISGAHSRAWLARTRLAPFVDIVVGGDDVVLGKPEPEPYRIALVRSGGTRELSIAVEDSPLGAKSALAAGIRCYAVAAENAPVADWPEGVRLIESLDKLILELERPRTRRVAGRR